MGLVAICATATTGGWAADHIDSPAAVADPAADITDIYTWMESDAAKLNLVMNVTPFAAASASFSSSVIYSFHVTNVNPGVSAKPYEVRCKFYDATNIECWVLDGTTVLDYVTGDPAATAGIDSDSGKVKVFAGLRNDPFFFNLDGFNDTIETVKGAAAGLTFNSEGCPTNVDAPTSAALVAKLAGDPAGGAGKDKFLGANVLSLVIQLDKTLVNADGPLVQVWSSTHAAN